MYSNPNQNYGEDPIGGQGMPWDKTLSPVNRTFKIGASIVAVLLTVACGYQIVAQLMQ